MDQPEPRARHRGYFFHVEPHSLDSIENVEQETAEGVPIRFGSSRKASPAGRTPSVRSDASADPIDEKSETAETVRSANVTGSRRQGRTSR
jgi:hypothetical protein